MFFKQQVALPKQPLPIVIIGAGGIIEDAHLPAYQMAGFNVLGIYDVISQKADMLKSKFSCVEKAYASLPMLMVDAIGQNAVFDIAVPAKNIVPILEQLPDKSCVLIQKPMGETLEEAVRIRQICRKKQLVSAINFQLRYAPYCIAARQIVESGLIGEVFDMEIKVRVHTPWERWDFLKGLPRLEILYHSIHYLDLIRSFWGNPEKIYASTVKHPKVSHLAATRSSILLDYENDRQARVLTDHGHDYGTETQQSYFFLQGTEGAVKIIIGLSLNYPKGKPPKLVYYLAKEPKKGWQEVPLSGGWFPHAFIGSMAVLQNHVLDTSQPLPHSTEDAYETMRLVELAYKSNAHGGIDVKNSCGIS